MKTKSISHRWQLVIQIQEHERCAPGAVWHFGLWKCGAGFRLGSGREKDPPKSDESTMAMPQALAWAARMLLDTGVTCRMDDRFWRAVEKWARTAKP